jgi:hypothetical protein
MIISLHVGGDLTHVSTLQIYNINLLYYFHTVQTDGI